jgi:hypothetical protein
MSSVLDTNIIKKEIERQLKRGKEATDNCLLMRAEALIDKAYRHLTIAEALQLSLEYVDSEKREEALTETVKNIIRKCEIASSNPSMNKRIINEILCEARGVLYEH